VLLEENLWLEGQIADRTYTDNYVARVDNSTYGPIIDQVLKLLKQDASAGVRTFSIGQ